MSTRIGAISIGKGHPLLLIAGPCAAEDESVVDAAASCLRDAAAEHGISLIFKASYEKDNRTSGQAYRGPGREQGLRLLALVRARYGLPVTTDVHRVDDVEAVAGEIDLVQIPALLCRQSSLLDAVGRVGKPVNLKKGQFANRETIQGALDKLRRAGASDLLISERGSCWGPERLVVDFAGLSELAALGAAVVVDASHAAPRPASIAALACAAVAAGADGVFLECHPDPPRAHCDGARMLALSQMPALIAHLAALRRVSDQFSSA
ncbi:MAG: 3-deoxy-8-phosphooctulonate synthase [Deltaproteobacteria bacterium]|nr:3-deoxy-8-phosphooctulonate synthase [Deltaproteobacteria bacterium]